MKKLAKLLAVVLAFAMVASVMVMPVSATTALQQVRSYVAPYNVNLLEEWGFGLRDYETTTNTSGNLYGWEGKTLGLGNTTNVQLNGYMTPVANVGVDNSAAALVQLGYKNSGGTATDDGPRLLWVPLEPGEFYMLTADIKINSETQISSKVSAHVDASSVNAITKDTQVMITNYDTITSTGYSTVKAMIKVAASEVANPNRAHAHIGFAIPKANADNIKSIYVDNWTLTKLPGQDLSHGAGLSPESDTTNEVTFANGVYNMKPLDGKNAGVARRISIKAEANTKYCAVAYVKDADGKLDSTVTVGANAFCCWKFSAANLKMISTDNTVGTEWKKVVAYVKTNEGPCDSHDHSKGGQYNLHFGFKFTTTAAQCDDVLVKDFAVYKITNTTTATLTPAAATNAPLETTVSCAFTDVPTTAVTAANIAIEGGAGSVKSVTATSSKSYDVVLTGLEYSKTYAVKLTGVKDKYELNIADASTSIATMAKPVVYTGELFTDNDFDGDFNDISKVTKVDGVTTVQAEVDGEKVLSLTTAKNYAPAVRMNNLSKNIENTGKYIVTYKVKNAENSKVTDVALWASQSTPYSNKRMPVNYMTAPVTISETEWTDVTAYFDMSVYDPNGSTKKDYARQEYNRVMANEFTTVPKTNDKGAALSSAAYKEALDKAYEAAYAAADDAEKERLAKIKADAQTKYDNGVNPDKWVEGPMHLGFTVLGTGTVYIDKVEVRKATALDLSAADFARVMVKNNTASVAMTSDEAKTVYVIAAKYNGTKMTDVKFGSAAIDKNVVSVALPGVDDTYSLFIWDSNLKPLSNTKLISEF